MNSYELIDRMSRLKAVHERTFRERQSHPDWHGSVATFTRKIDSRRYDDVRVHVEFTRNLDDQDGDVKLIEEIQVQIWKGDIGNVAPKTYDTLEWNGNKYSCMYEVAEEGDCWWRVRFQREFKESTMAHKGGGR